MGGRMTAHPADEYQWLSSTFAAACRLADRRAGPQRVFEDIPIVKEHGVPSASALQRYYECELANAQRRLPKATIDAIDFLLRQNDAARLEKFLEGLPKAEADKILAYIESKSS
jgi:hypothetical protein